jgi:hypothetical protein
VNYCEDYMSFEGQATIRIGRWRLICLIAQGLATLMIYDYGWH